MVTFLIRSIVKLFNALFVFGLVLAAFVLSSHFGIKDTWTSTGIIVAVICLGFESLEDNVNETSAHIQAALKGNQYH
jgi:hypothetical protein